MFLPGESHGQRSLVGNRPQGFEIFLPLASTGTILFLSLLNCWIEKSCGFGCTWDSYCVPVSFSSDCQQSCSSKPFMERALLVLTHFFLFWLLRPLSWVFILFCLFTYVKIGGWSLLTGVRHTNVGEIFSTPQRMATYKPEDCQLPDMKGASTF